MIEKDKDLVPYTTFGVPAKARYFAEYSSLKELQRIIKTDEYLDNEVLHIGGGSNLLFVHDFNGLILHSRIKGFTHYVKDESHHYVIAGAGEKWTDFVDWCIANDLAGVENMAGIPGEVGAAPVQNVGAYGREAKDVVFSVECYDTLEHQVVKFTNEECRFSYRDSMFKHEGKGRYYVLRVAFLLKNTDKAEHLEYGQLKDFAMGLGAVPTLRQLADEVIRIRNQKLPDPAEIGSAGSFFKNPIVNSYFFREEVQPRDKDVKFFPLENGRVKLAAGWLIEHAGLKGCKVGGAEVYPKQCLVIANTGGATAEDVMQLCHKVQRQVDYKFGVRLEPEVNLIDTSIKVTVLGSGTSKGIPEVGCHCPVCESEDPRDKRLRASVFVQTHGVNLLIDPGPDFRQQALAHDIDRVDAVLVTHSHYDHVGGFDDLRPFCATGDIDVYLKKDVNDDLHHRIDYCFRNHTYPGVPKFNLHEIDATTPFFINGVEIIPIEVMHGKLPILGYRIGNFAYITDAKTISPYEMEKLEDLDTLIINALHHKEHFAHLNLTEALEIVKLLKPQRVWFTHMSHHMGKAADIEPILPENVHLAHDGMQIYIP